jgi:predicted nucleic acid-binding protein
VVAAHQHLTREWWLRRERFDLFVSEAVLEEAAAGNPEAAAKRSAALDGLPVLRVDTAVGVLARRLIESGAVPSTAKYDAIHIAVAAIHGIDLLLTWNCTHIANASARGKIEQVCTAGAYVPPVLCTPEELGAD